MNEVLGLIDALEATILEAKKVPMTQKIIIEEKLLLEVIDKIRLTLKSNGDMARKSIDRSQVESVIFNDEQTHLEKPITSGTEVLLEAKHKSNQIKSGANDYADYVLAHLQLMVTKMQKNIVKLENNIKSGRNVIDTQKREVEENQYEETQQPTS